MYNELKEKYREVLLKLKSSARTDGNDKIELARLFITIGDDIRSKNISSNIQYYNDAAIHYTYAISISKKLLADSSNQAIIEECENIRTQSEAKLKKLHFNILDQIKSDTQDAILEAKKVRSFSVDEISNKSYISGLREDVKNELRKITQHYEEVTNSFPYTQVPKELIYFEVVEGSIVQSTETHKELISERLGSYFDLDILSLYTEKSTALFDKIAASIKSYFTSLIESSVVILGQAPCKYTIIGLGSMAMRHMTPYSDLEFAILIEDNAHKDYFKNLSHYINFKVICLGESMIPYSLYELNLDHLGKKGINFDLGGKTSLGRRDKDYDLVCSVDDMIKYLKGDYQAAEGKRDDKLEHILENTCYICGNDGGYETSLLKQYQERAKDYLLSISPESGHTYSFDRGVQLLKGGDLEEAQKNRNSRLMKIGNLEQFQFDASGNEGKMFDVKQEIYRLPDRLIYNFGLIYELTATKNGLSGVEIVDKLLSKEIINSEAAIHLKETISYANILRLRVYDFYEQQKESMDIIPNSGMSSSKETNFRISPHEMSEGGSLFRYYYTAIELHKSLAEFCKEQENYLKTTPLTHEEISLYFIDNSFYQPTFGNKAQICLRLSMYEKESEYELRCYEALKSPLEKIRSATHLVDIYDDLGNKAKVDEFLKKAKSLLSELDEVDRPKGQVLFNEAYVSAHLKGATQTEEAVKLIKLCDDSIRIRSENGIANNIQDSKVLKARILYESEKYVEAIKEYEELKESYPNILKGKGGITILSKLAVSYSKIGQPEKAKDYINQALQRGTDRLEEDPFTLAKVFNIKGFVHFNLDEHQEALESSERFLRYKDLMSIKDKAAALANYGITLSLNGQHDKAISRIKESIELCQSEEGEEFDQLLVQAKKDLAKAYSRAGNFYHEKNDYKKALNYYKQGIEINEEIFEENLLDTAAGYINIYNVMRFMYTEDEALKYLTKGLSIYTRPGIKLPQSVAYFLFEEGHTTHKKCIRYFLSASEKNYIKAVSICKEKLLPLKLALYGEESFVVMKFLSYLRNQYMKLTEEFKSTNWAKELVDLMNFGLKRPITNFAEEIPNHDPIDGSVRIVSYNIAADFFDNKDITSDLRHHWNVRYPFVLKLLSQITPDIMCLQELSAEQARSLSTDFKDRFKSIFLSQTPSEVERTGAICDDEEVVNWTGKKLGTPLIGIFVNSSTNWQIVKEKTGRFWLNESPDEVPNAYDRGQTDKGFGNMNTYRAVLWCMAINTVTGKEIYIFNSHYPLAGNSQTRLRCAELERSKIKEIAGEAKWVSAGDRNLIKCDDDNPDFNPLTIYKTLVRDAYDIRDHRPDKHYGISGTWLGFRYDKYKSKIGTDATDVLDVMVSNMKPITSFFHPGIFDLAAKTIIPLSSYKDSAILDSYNESRYFASDHALIGADLCSE